MMEKNSRIDRFTDELNTLINLILECETDLGFIENTVRLVKFLNCDELTSEITLNWERVLAQHFEIIPEAYEELIEAIGELQTLHPQVKQHVEDLLNKVCSGGTVMSMKDSPLKQLYYTLRVLYCNFYKRSWDVLFAPKAYNVIQFDKSFSSEIEAKPYLLWHQFKSLEDAWTRKNEGLYCGWDKQEGDIRTRLIQTHDAFIMAFRNDRASELYFLREPGYQPRYFQREQFKRYVERLRKEIFLNIRQYSDYKNNHASWLDNLNVHGKTKKYLEDFSILTSLYIQVREKSSNPLKISREKLTEIVQQEVQLQGIKLNNPTPSLYEAAAKMSDYRKIFPRGKKSKKKDNQK